MILVDGSHLLHRVLNTENISLINSEGRVIGGVHGFLSSLSKIACDRLRMEGILVAWDLGIPLHRREIYPNYKPHKRPIGSVDLNLLSEMNREGYTEEEDPDRAEFRKIYADSASILHELLPLTGTVSIRLPNVEADDVLSVWSYYFKDYGVIYSSDMDLVQLVSENINFYDARHDKYITKNDVINENGFSPSTWRRDWLLAKAIYGDTSDSINGVGQVGAKASPAYAKQLGRYMDSGMTISQACMQDLERPYRGRKEGLDNIRVSGDLIQRNFDLMDLHLPIERNLPIVREIKSGICANSLILIDRSKLEDKLDELELFKAQDFCMDLSESNKVDSLQKYSHYFL